MKKLTSLFLLIGATLASFGAQNGVSYDSVTRNVNQTDLDFEMSSLSVSNALVAINNWVQLSGQTNRLTIAGGALLLDGVPVGGGGGIWVTDGTYLYAVNGSYTNALTVQTNGGIYVGAGSLDYWGAGSGSILIGYQNTSLGQANGYEILAATGNGTTLYGPDMYGNSGGQYFDINHSGLTIPFRIHITSSETTLSLANGKMTINPLSAGAPPYSFDTENDFGAGTSHVFKNAGTETAKLTGLGFFSALKSVASYDLNFNAYPEQPDGSSPAYDMVVKTPWTSTNYTHRFGNGTTNMIGITADNKLTFKDVNYLQPSGEYLTLNSDASTLFSLLEFRNEANPNIAASVGTSPSGAWIQSTEPQVDFTYGTNTLSLFQDGIRTNPPNEATNSQAFKIGVPAGSVGLTLISTQYIQISLDGVAYKLAIVKE